MSVELRLNGMEEMNGTGGIKATSGTMDRRCWRTIERA